MKNANGTNNEGVEEQEIFSTDGMVYGMLSKRRKIDLRTKLDPPGKASA